MNFTDLKYVIAIDKYGSISLDGCIEVVHGDKRLPSGDYVDLCDYDREEHFQKKAYIYERGSHFDILSTVPNTLMWVSHVPQNILDKYDLVQLRCGAFAEYMKDVMIFKENHVPKKNEKKFLDILRERTREYGCYF